MGFFPDREPAAAAALIALLPGRLEEVLGVLAHEATVCVDAEDSRIRTLSEVVDGQSVAVGVDALGRMGVSAEFGFVDRVPAMLERRWDPILATSAFDEAREAVPYLLATQAVHDFADLFALTMLSGIDHCKITPDGRMKAYVGILPFQRGVGINGLPPGTP
jgi:hypothetical protein